MRTIFLILILVLISFSCAKDLNDDDTGNLNQSCKAENICESNLACINNVCVSKSDACKYVTCTGNDGSSHGICNIENSNTVCDCNDGYERVNNTKCISKDAPTTCEQDTCSGKPNSVCKIENGRASCVCLEGYKSDIENDCFLDETYFCKNVVCDYNKNMTGFCKAEEVENEAGEVSVETHCECEPGWSGDKCEDSDAPDCSICENDLNATGECRIDPEDPEQEVICICNQDFEYDTDAGCISTNGSKNIRSGRIIKGTLNNECFKGDACLSGLTCSNNKCIKASKLTKNTIIITKKESNSELLKVEKDKLTFLKNDRTALFRKNLVLAFQETSLLKDGFIGKIKSVKVLKDKVIVITDEVSPFDILGEFKLNIEKDIMFDSVLDPNAATASKTANKTFNYDKTFYRNTSKVKGDMSIKYSFKMLIDLRRTNSYVYRLNKFDVTHDIELTSNLDLTLNATSFTNEKIQIRFQGVDVLTNQKVSSFTVYLPYGVKTKAEVYLSARLLHSANMQGFSNIKIKTKSNIKSGIKYENGRTTRTNSYKNEKLSLDERINLDGRAGVTFKVIPEVRFTAYSSSIHNEVTIGTEVLFTQALLNSTLESTGKPCYSLEGIISSSPYAFLDMMKTSSSHGVSLSWNKQGTVQDKTINWLDESKKCDTFACETDDECHVNQASLSSTCSGGSCDGSDSGVDYEYIDIPGADFIRGCVGTGLDQ